MNYFVFFVAIIALVQLSNVKSVELFNEIENYLQSLYIKNFYLKKDHELSSCVLLVVAK